MLPLSWTICLNTLLFYSASATRLVEYRITMPFSLDEYEIGRLYGTDKFSVRESTTEDFGIEVVLNQPFSEKTIGGMHLIDGQYTYKIFHLENVLPQFIRLLLPRGHGEFNEKSWNAYPLCYTKLNLPDMPQAIEMNTTTRHVANDKGNLDNVHNLREEDLARRQVRHVDIATYPTEDMTYNPNTCQTSRGSLAPGWQETWTGPVMTAYKLVEIKSVWFGLATRMESMTEKKMNTLNAELNKQIFCTMDQWLKLDMDDIRKLDEETKKELIEHRLAMETAGMSHF